MVPLTSFVARGQEPRRCFDPGSVPASRREKVPVGGVGDKLLLPGPQEVGFDSRHGLPARLENITALPLRSPPRGWLAGRSAAKRKRKISWELTV